MAYVDCKNSFTAILNRRDITTSLINTFMGNAIQRIQRNLRLPTMEKVLTVTMDGVTPLSVPNDLLVLIDMTIGDPVFRKVRGTTYEKAAAYSTTSGTPMYYYRSGGTYILGPYAASGQVITLRYYCDITSLTNDADTNWLTEIAPDLLVYGALSYACDYFLDSRVKPFEERFIGIMQDLQLMANEELLSGGATIDAGQEFGTYIDNTNQ